MSLSDFVRKWGPSVSHITAPDGSTRIAAGHGGDLTREAAADWERIADQRSFVASFRIPRFRETIRINPSFKRSWNIDEDNILDAKTLTGQRMQKFSWNPLTGEFILIWPGQQHASAQLTDPFDDYIRGIVLHNQKLVTFRPYWPTWMQATTSSFQDPDAKELSFAAQSAAAWMLHKHGAKDWTFRKDISNKALQEMTGRGQW